MGRHENAKRKMQNFVRRKIRDCGLRHGLNKLMTRQLNIILVQTNSEHNRSSSVIVIQHVREKLVPTFILI